ncbi:hypothetical protein [Sediminibacterium goheungense]|uniref:Uncharacterized protein n=1 Tax=Sediminibacterium goheungense TaxID=1086393 RepID=A0A4R6J081_9BACT|nr:hypothetical protein [Sediminibacterium goheungense]TDO28141.1 hypothetical protein BC659_0201 [Sediminibacterium goheungense]
MSFLKSISYFLIILIIFPTCKKQVNKENALCEQINSVIPIVRIYEEVEDKLFLTDTILDGSFAVLDVNLLLDGENAYNPFKIIEWEVGNLKFSNTPKIRQRFSVGSVTEITIRVLLKYNLEQLPCRTDTSAIFITKKLVVKPINTSRIIGTYTGTNQGENEPPFTVSIKDEYRNNAFYGYWIKNINKGCYQGLIPSSQELIKPGVQMTAGYIGATFREPGENCGCINVSGSLVLQGNKIIIDYRYANELEYGAINNPTYYNKKFIGFKN